MLTKWWDMYIRFRFIVPQLSEMIAKLVDSSIDMPFRVVRTAERKIENTSVVLFAMPTTQLRLYLLPLIRTQIKIFYFC
jgi:hypothetical protein